MENPPGDAGAGELGDQEPGSSDRLGMEITAATHESQNMGDMEI
eukprot:CAMPEP_0172320916 /NCGR_PEP_ID=MMETSP1058-20130122/41780_1 /TAXON_ID=83371 /ORGANISM="Detonula confervacea, Strain CCMP 353" /LENGTH=43 /DNA_ID= /DNA_START= /DNA_END= /DNA_ORIENTATION=